MFENKLKKRVHFLFELFCKVILRKNVFKMFTFSEPTGSCLGNAKNMNTLVFALPEEGTFELFKYIFIGAYF
jgi:hypothetical protein